MKCSKEDCLSKDKCHKYKPRTFKETIENSAVHSKNIISVSHYAILNDRRISSDFNFKKICHV